ncbi:hypothetical protein A4X13_0g6660, partial [Tilletia indica]
IDSHTYTLRPSVALVLIVTASSFHPGNHSLCEGSDRSCLLCAPDLPVHLICRSCATQSLGPENRLDIWIRGQPYVAHLIRIVSFKAGSTKRPDLLALICASFFPSP